MRSKRTDGNSKCFLLCAAFFVFCYSFFVSCKQEDDKVVYQQQRHWVNKTVAVVAPLSHAPTKTRLERTAQWMLDNFHEAQLHDTLCVRLELEWHDEQREDLTVLSQKLAEREDVIAVIGPLPTTMWHYLRLPASRA